MQTFPERACTSIHAAFDTAPRQPPRRLCSPHYLLKNDCNNQEKSYALVQIEPRVTLDTAPRDPAVAGVFPYYLLKND